MFELTCPTCGKRVQGDDSLLGKHVACPGCNTALTAPHATLTAITDAPVVHPSSDGAFSEGLPPHEPAVPSLRIAAPHILARMTPFLIVIGILFIGALLLVPSVEKVREAAARTQSVNNLKQIGLAMQSFHDANKRLPFNGTVVAVGGDEQSGSWAFQILPYIDQFTMFKQPDATVAVPPFVCPGRARPSVSTTGAWTDYFINPWLNDANGVVDAPDIKRTLLGITDGSSNTIFAGHGTIDPGLYESKVALAQSTDIFKGGNPALARRTTTNQADKAGDGGLYWGGSFPQGALVCFCDGVVRMNPYRITGGVITDGVSTFPVVEGVDSNVGFLGPLLTPKGNEPVGMPD